MNTQTTFSTTNPILIRWYTCNLERAKVFPFVPLKDKKAAPKKEKSPARTH